MGKAMEKSRDTNVKGAKIERSGKTGRFVSVKTNGTKECVRAASVKVGKEISARRADAMKRLAHR